MGTNKKFGWKQGDIFLKEFVAFLQNRYPQALIFRVQGDDFAMVSKEYIKLGVDNFKEIKDIDSANIPLSIKHFDLKEDNLISAGVLEEILSSS